MNKQKNKKQQRLLQSRRGVMMIALIAVLVLLINLITASYSWFTPQSETKGGMFYSFTGQTRSENCTIRTVKGRIVGSQNIENGEYVNQIRYDPSYPGENIEVSGIVTLDANQTRYFKTEIINQDPLNASDISLYFNMYESGTWSGRSFTLAVTYPANSVRNFTTSETNDIYIVRDAYVKPRDDADVNGPGLLEIEWFVKAGSNPVRIDFRKMYLVYN